MHKIAPASLAVSSLLLLFPSVGCRPKPKPPAAKMAHPAVVEGMAELAEPLHACAEKHNVSGYAQVKVHILDDGSVSSVQLGQRFGGTPAGECVRAVISKGRFEVGGAMIIRYPVLLR